MKHVQSHAHIYHIIVQIKVMVNTVLTVNWITTAVGNHCLRYVSQTEWDSVGILNIIIALCLSYSRSRIYQYNEDDFRFQFLFLKAFKQHMVKYNHDNQVKPSNNSFSLLSR